MNWDEWEKYDGPLKYNLCKLAKILNDPTKHYPNKKEGKELRRIRAETGLTEVEIRSHKKYRKRLSDAQHSGGPGRRRFGYAYKEETFKDLLKMACKELGLAKEHPKTIKRIQELNKERNRTLVFTKLDDNEILHFIKKNLRKR